MIPDYPEVSNLSIELRRELHPFFKSLKNGISEFTFANLYLFRDVHKYQIAKLKNGLFLIIGDDKRDSFFMLPFGLPEKELLDELFHNFTSMKCVSEGLADKLTRRGYAVVEDRNNFDYLYLREELVKLPGAKFHKKKNLVNAFINSYSYQAKPLLKEYVTDAITVLEMWRHKKGNYDDYSAAGEALEKMEELQLCGGIYYVDGKPAPQRWPEVFGSGGRFVIHFEK